MGVEKDGSGIGAMSRRQFLGRVMLTGAALGAFGPLVAACGAAGGKPSSHTAGTHEGRKATQVPQRASSGNAVTLRVLWNDWGALYNKYMTKIGDDFTRANPTIKIQWDFSGEFETQLLTNVAGGRPPDVAFTNYTTQTALAQKGTLIPLDDYFKAADIKPDDFNAMFKYSLWKGKSYAIPGGADYYVLCWSKPVFEAVGLDPNKPPKTADELIEDSKRMLKKDSKGNIERIGYNPVYSDQFIRWLHVFGGRLYDPDTNKITADDPHNVEMMQWLYDYVKLVGANKLSTFQSLPGGGEEPDTGGNVFATKRLGFFITGFWVYQELDQYAPHIPYGLTTFPTLHGTPQERKNWTLTGWLVAIPSGVKHQDESWKFLKFAFVDKDAEMGYETLNGPCYRPTFDAFENGLRKQAGPHDRIIPYLDVFTETAKYATKTWPVIPVDSYYDDQLSRAYDYVLHGKMTPKQALSEVTKNVQQELDKVLTTSRIYKGGHVPA